MVAGTNPLARSNSYTDHQIIVGTEGLEPSHRKILVPKTSVSTIPPCPHIAEVYT